MCPVVSASHHRSGGRLSTSALRGQPALMDLADDEQLETLLPQLLESLPPLQRALVLQSIVPAERALQEAQEQHDVLVEDVDADLQEAASEYEQSQVALAALEGGDTPATEVEQVRSRHRKALEVMEECMAQRTKCLAAFAGEKAQLKQNKWQALRSAIAQLGSDDTQPQSASPDESTPAATAAVAAAVPAAALASVPVTASMSDQAMESTAQQQNVTSTPALAHTTDGRTDGAWHAAEYEPLQAEHVDLVIRVGDAFKKLGIKLNETGVVTSAPGGLFDREYSVLVIDGKLFSSGDEDSAGPHNVILRCRKADILTSLKQQPEKQLRGKALKLTQVKVTPDGKGFGIDLSESNCVAGLVKGGRAEAADVRVGDVIVAADGVNLGSRKLVEVLKKGRSSHVFTVVRPAAMTDQDRVFRPSVTPPGSRLPLVAASTASTAPAVAEDGGAATDDDDLRRSLAESLGQLQHTTAMLTAQSATPVARILRTSPVNGTAIMVEWQPRPGSCAIDHYHLEWKKATSSEWSHTEASMAIKATVVTKGNLDPDAPYQFRVRACGKETGEWGPWSSPSEHMAPNAIVDDGLSTIIEEGSIVASSIAPSSVAPQSKAQSAAQSRSAGIPSALGPPLQSIQVLLLDQRQALEAEHAQEVARLQEELRVELALVREEVEDWKAKFVEAAGNSMQAVLEAKEITRVEVLAEIEADVAKAEDMKAEASQAIELIRAAEAKRDEAVAEAGHYKERFDRAKSEAKAETDREAQVQVNHVMRNAALEMRDKVKFVEQQTEATVRRAVDEAVRQTVAKAEAAKRNALHEMAAVHEKQLQAMRDMVSAGTKQKIADVQSMQDSRVQHAVKMSLQNAKQEAAKAEALAVQAAVANAIAETEAKMNARHGVLEQNLARMKEELSESRASQLTEEAASAMVAHARAEERQAKDAAVREAVAQTQERATLEAERLKGAIGTKLQEVVRDREQELLADDGRLLSELADAELAEQSERARSAGRVATDTWGAGNDDFEEHVLVKTLPSTGVLDSDVLLALPAPKSKSATKKMTEKRGATDALVALGGPGKWSVGGHDDDNESMVAPPVEYIKMKARHAAEEQALLTRQEVDEFREGDEDEAVHSKSRREARAKRTTEKEELKVRQLNEAMAMGADLAYQDRAKMAAEDVLESPEALAMLRSPAEEQIEQLTEKNPALKSALDRVKHLEKKLRSIEKKPSDGDAPDDKTENKRMAATVQNMIGALDSRKKAVITDVERGDLNEVMELLSRHQKRGKAMQELLNGVSNGADEAVNESATVVENDLAQDQDVIGALSEQLQAIVARDSAGVLDAEEKAMLRQLVGELKHQQEQAEMREAQLAWLRAEAKKARMMAVFDAREQLERLNRVAQTGDQLALPTTPVAAAEDESSISVDWLPPNSGLATVYHLQWRSDKDDKWASSSASEQLKVPCCMKGNLRTQSMYEFRVRAGDGSGAWGAWSEPTEPTKPDKHLHKRPSRPQARAASKGWFYVHWSPPESKVEVTFYELQWRLSNHDFDETSESCIMEVAEPYATTPPLPQGCYTFRVRACVQRKSGADWTDYSPSSAPVQPPVKDASRSKSGGKGKSSRADSTIPKGGSMERGDVQEVVPLRSLDDASESVIEADIREAQRSNKYHPAAQAAVDAHLQELSKKRQEDAANLQLLEDRNQQLSEKAKEDRLKELVGIKQGVIDRSVGGTAANSIPDDVGWD